MKKQIANWGNYPVMESDEKSFGFEDQLKSLLKTVMASSHVAMAVATAMRRWAPKPFLL